MSRGKSRDKVYRYRFGWRNDRLFMNSAVTISKRTSSRAATRNVRTLDYIGKKSFPDIPERLYRRSVGRARDAAAALQISFSRSRRNYRRGKYFLNRPAIPKWVGGGGSRAERKPRWSEHDENVRDKMQEAGASAEIPRGCLPRMRAVKRNCLRARLPADICATILRELSRLFCSSDRGFYFGWSRKSTSFIL